MTNADRFRSMTDEELAEFLEGVSESGCPPGFDYNAFCGDPTDCKTCWLGWLKQEVQE